MCLSRPAAPPPTPKPAAPAPLAAEVKPALESGAKRVAKQARTNKAKGTKRFRVKLNLSPARANVGGSGATGLNIPKIRG